jgi:uncharacterized protein
MARFRILSLDGGGIRGLISSILLIRLNREKGLEGWLERADLLAGTSTGALIALLLAKGLGLEEIRALYHDTSRDIFDDSWLDDVKDVGTLLGAQYHSDGLKRHLQRMLGKARLRDLKKRVLITAFDLDNEHPRPEKRRWKPKLFHNFPGADSGPVHERRADLLPDGGRLRGRRRVRQQSLDVRARADPGCAHRAHRGAG